jgi:hypothetical protein
MATCGLLSEWRMRREPRYQSFVVSEMGWCMWYWFFSGVRRVVSQFGGRIELIEQRVASDGTRKLLFQVEAPSGEHTTHHALMLWHHPSTFQYTWCFNSLPLATTKHGEQRSGLIGYIVSLFRRGTRLNGRRGRREQKGRRGGGGDNPRSHRLAQWSSHGVHLKPGGLCHELPGTLPTARIGRIGFRVEMSSRRVSRRPPISRCSIVARPEGLHVRRESVGFVHRSRAIFCRPCSFASRGAWG